MMRAGDDDERLIAVNIGPKCCFMGIFPGVFGNVIKVQTAGDIVQTWRGQSQNSVKILIGIDTGNQ